MPGKRGLYALAPMWGTSIVVVNELPKDPETMWLRLFGRGDVQGGAVLELDALSEQHPLRDATLRTLLSWKQGLPPSMEQSEDEREMTMNLERVYEQWEKKTLAKGKAEGKVEGKIEGKIEGKVEATVETLAKAVLTVLESRGLAVTPAQRKQVLACTDVAMLDAWLRGAATTSGVTALLAGTAARRAREKRGRSAV